MKFSHAISAARLIAFPAAAISTAFITAITMSGATPAHAAARTVPAVASLRNHPYVATFTPADMWAWRNPTNDPGNCPANPSQITHNATMVVVHTTGANGNCAAIESRRTWPATDGYVYEARVYFSAIPGTDEFADWNSYWLYGSDWPVDGEFDAVETTFGTQFVSYHYGTNNSEVSTCNESNDCDAGVGVMSPKRANIKPGWHTIDVVYGNHRIALFYDGKLYTIVAGSFVNPKPVWITFSAGSSSSMDKAGVHGEVAVQWVKVFK
jgi:hypothetical protein